MFHNSTPALPPLITTVGTLKQQAEPHFLFVEVSWDWRCVEEVADKPSLTCSPNSLFNSCERNCLQMTSHSLVTYKQEKQLE